MAHLTIGNNMTETAEILYEHFIERKGQFFRPSDLAIKLRIPTVEVRSAINELGDLVTMKNLYGKLGYGVEDENMPKYQPRWSKPFTPLKLDAGMIQAMERCKADRGCEYHPITIS